jgi:hypothetical protein
LSRPADVDRLGAILKILSALSDRKGGPLSHRIS